MRRRHFFLTIAYLLTAVFLAGCSFKGGDGGETRVNVFYPDQDFMALTGIERTVSSGSSAIDKADELIRAMSTVPFREKVRPVFGKEAVLKDRKLEDGVLKLDFTVSYNSLSKTGEVLTRAAVVETLSQVEGIDSVVFLIEGRPLKDPEGKEIGPMTKDTFINDMGDEINTYDRRTLNLYFSNMDGTYLRKYSRTVVYTANLSVEKLIVQSLIEGPQEAPGFYPTLPRDTGLLGVTVKNGTCYVNFDGSIREKPYNVSEGVVIYSIVNSLTELDSVDNVQIAVDGVSDGVLFDEFNLNNAYERNLEIVK